MYMYKLLSVHVFTANKLLTSAVDEYNSSLIETRVEVSLKWGNVLGQMNKLMQVCSNINKAWKRHVELVLS